MKEKSVIQDVLLWDEVTAKCNYDSKKCRQLVSEIMKIINERETQTKKTMTEKNKEEKTIMKGWG